MKTITVVGCTILASLSLFSCQVLPVAVPEIVFLNSHLDVSEHGGKVELRYTVNNSVEESSTYAESEVDWIKDIVVSNGRLSFSVDKNIQNEKRTGEIILYYNYDEGIVTARGTILQAGYDTYEYRLEASDFYAEYSGIDGDLHVFEMILSDKEFHSPHSKNYQFQIMTDMSPNYDNIVFPSGEYIVSSGFVSPGVVTPENSFYSEYGANAEYPEIGPLQIVSGNVNIVKTDEAYKIDCIISDINGEMHHVVYSGSTSVVDKSYLSTLGEDVAVDLSGHIAIAYYYGDYAGYGSSNWYVWIIPDDEFSDGDVLMLDLYADISKAFEEGIPEGIYARGEGSLGTFMPGFIYSSALQSSWYYRMEQGSVGDLRTPLYDGHIEVIKNSDDTYTFNVYCVDDNYRNPHNVSGSWTGIVEVLNESSII